MHPIQARTALRAAAALATGFALAALLALPAHGARIKDIASVSGMRKNQLVGYGLVVGLSGTGDQRGSDFTVQSIYNMLDKMGVRVDKATLKPKNVAAVMVTAQMPVSAKPGSRLDVTVSSIGDSTSLLGGVLLVTPMKGVDGNIYAIAQGSVLVGGVSAQGAGASVSKNVTTVAMLPGGANVERAVAFSFNEQSDITLSLRNPDFTTAAKVAKRVNETMGAAMASAVDAGTVRLAVPPENQGNLVPLLASIENIEVTPDHRARVVVDEKTGTVVLGQNVQISPVAVTHGNLQIQVQESADVSQPLPFSGGQTVVTPQTNIGVNEENRKLKMIEGATLQELVEGLNALGATPRDLISVLRTLEASGALSADLEVN
ncbi:flagellar basal body P-ring protein FlgI [Solidesulfovibrio sp.]|jgi:flagellar P-ring protein precursor FlgI|uniref:flagellar basal body P-ring protein FlgI n=1 Tax=Solidesulfovibrio sp. TaxID=2910990 RepID=UPI002B1F0C7D|nr:flagellar basal body P-ring protein FlgI [Solidesulfovibrio sp.]MEA5087978.1 flagellar basal body P-ring protein FlgI [Solidesulfovibrio sp.]